MPTLAAGQARPALARGSPAVPGCDPDNPPTPRSGRQLAHNSWKCSPLMHIPKNDTFMKINEMIIGMRQRT